ncbi:MAG TPA: iron-containing alcohol dehydrogenase [Solirubrobacteraceae bacterium]|jgi:maleylacetate reductase|nr:iron-containing alcohol dehydrogenase [Solirubrobacteraceae bacterium]
MPDRFRHEEAERTIVFGAGALEAADDLLGSGYTLLTTPRAERAAPDVVERAGAVVHVPGGRVEDVAAALRPDVQGDRLVALGGGRVVDVAKALAAADGPREVLAIPTSLSAAEMTGSHRHARGVPADTPRVRPRMVVNDPALSASQPTDQLAASTANALGHATVGLLSDRTTPIPRAVAREAIAHLVAGWSGPEPDRSTLALGALLAGWSIDHSGLGPHHALAQTLVRTAGLGHAHANAAVLPASIAALRRRRAAELDRLDAELGTPLEAFARSLRERAGVRDFDGLDRLVETAAERAELARVAPPPDRDELREIYREAGASG